MMKIMRLKLSENGQVIVPRRGRSNDGDVPVIMVELLLYNGNG